MYGLCGSKVSKGPAAWWYKESRSDALLQGGLLASLASLVSLVCQDWFLAELDCWRNSPRSAVGHTRRAAVHVAASVRTYVHYSSLAVYGIGSM